MLPAWSAFRFLRPVSFPLNGAALSGFLLFEHLSFEHESDGDTSNLIQGYPGRLGEVQSPSAAALIWREVPAPDPTEPRRLCSQMGSLLCEIFTGNVQTV